MAHISKASDVASNSSIVVIVVVVVDDGGDRNDPERGARAQVRPLPRQPHISRWQLLSVLVYRSRSMATRLQSSLAYRVFEHAGAAPPTKTAVVMHGILGALVLQSLLLFVRA